MRVKQFYCCLTSFLLLSVVSIHAQVSSYLFTQFTGNYVPLSFPGSTNVANGFQDDNVYGNIPIGFTFNFNNTTYTAVGLSTNGWMSFGGGVPSDNFAPVSSSNVNAISFMSGDMQLGPYQSCTITAGSNVIAFTNTLASSFFLPGDVLTGTGIPASTSVVAVGAGNMTISANATANGTMVTAGGRISYLTTGTAPNRVFTLQFRQLGRYNYDGTGKNDYVNAQIKLYETSNAVEVVYGYSGTFNNDILYSEVGLAGGNPSDYNNRSVPVGNNWIASSSGLSNAATCALSNSNTIPYGLVYRWTPPPPCAGAPASNTAVVASSLVCTGGNAFLNLAGSYSVSGLNFSWSSATSSVGPYTSLGTYTTPVLTAINITADTWFVCEITCTNSAQSSTTIPLFVKSVSTVTSSVPYFEGFENVPHNNVLPNCSWLTTGINCQTYTLSNTYNRLPKSGSKFAAFEFGTNPQGDAFFTNRILLYGGYTYSAALDYIADGAPGWSELALLWSSAQTIAGSQTIAAVSGTISNTAFNSLSGTFSVPVTGYYYIGVKAVGSYNPFYLSFDDLSVTAPCTLNEPSVSIIPSHTAVCNGSAVSFTAVGADSYIWLSSVNSASTAVVQVTPISSPTYTAMVLGGNLVGCYAFATQTLNVLTLPVAIINPPSQTVCVNETATLTALGAVSYTWNPSNHQSAVFVLTPASSYVFTVQAQGGNGCYANLNATLVVNACTKLDEQLQTDFKIAPNPFHEQIQLKGISGSVKWQMYDSGGRLLKAGIANQKENIISTVELTNGFYILEITSEQGIFRKKLIKH